MTSLIINSWWFTLFQSFTPLTVPLFPNGIVFIQHHSVLDSSQRNIRGEDKQVDDLTCTSADCKRQMRLGWGVDESTIQSKRHVKG